jgi:hypothetical protein
MTIRAPSVVAVVDPAATASRRNNTHATDATSRQPFNAMSAASQGLSM